MTSNGIRGGTAIVPNRFARAINKYMGDAYDIRWKPTKFITLPRCFNHNVTTIMATQRVSHYRHMVFK